jgi:hypothetical protein
VSQGPGGHFIGMGAGPPTPGGIRSKTRSNEDLEDGRPLLRALLKGVNAKETRTVIGIETGNSPGQLCAAVVDVSGMGDETELYLRGYYDYELPPELVSTLGALAEGGSFDSEEVAGINFLVLHHITNLFQDLLDETELSIEDVDLIGLKCLEAGKEIFPTDPAVLSEMTGLIVASRFSIGTEGNGGELLPLREFLLQGMVGDMIEKYSLESGVREAVAVALLANESLFHEHCEMCEAEGKRPTVKSAQSRSTAEEACLCAEFFFPR